MRSDALAQTHLILFFTRGVSLQIWDKVGMFDREVAIYKRLQEYGVQITFVTFGNAGDLAYADHIPGIRILCNIWGISQKRYERWLPILHGWYLRRADIFKTNQISGAEVAIRAARIYRKPIIVRCGYMWSYFASREKGIDSMYARVARKQEGHVLTAAHRVVVTTSHMKQYALDQYRLENSKIIVIPNYVITDLFQPNQNEIHESRTIFFLGRLDAQKNLFALLEAIRGLDVKLVIIGDGSQRQVLEELAVRSYLNVNFLGNLPHTELPQHFKEAEIFILPSLYEGHPKALLEAMSCGLPVIGTDVPGIRELIKHRETGYLCGTSSSAIRAAIQDLLEDKELRVLMGKRARNFVVDNFSIDHILKKELSLLSDLSTEEVN